MQLLVELLLFGLTLGGLYAMVAMGLTLQYGVARIMNLAYGEWLIAAAFCAFGMFTWLHVNPLATLVLALPVGFAINWLVYQLLLTPLVRRTQAGPALEVDSLLATFGLLWFVLPPLFPIIAFFYNGLTISGWRMATLGMKAMDLEMRLSSGARVPFLSAAVHAVLFYVSWMFPPILLVSLLDGKKRCLHDMLADVVVTRRAN